MIILRMRSHPLVTASDHVHIMVVISAQFFKPYDDIDDGDYDFFTIIKTCNWVHCVPDKSKNLT